MDTQGPTMDSSSGLKVFIHLLTFLAGPGIIDFSHAQHQQTYNPSGVHESNTSVSYPAETSPYVSSSVPFEWAAGPWGECGSRQNASFCGRFRDVFCVYSEGIKTQVPFYFCNGLHIPDSYQECVPCPENCVVDSWSLWSEWSGTCRPAYRYRTRIVLRAPRFGGRECGELSQTQQSLKRPDCRMEMILPSYKWRTGEWTSCRQPASAAPNSCMVGQRYRRVNCVDVEGLVADDSLCLQSGQPETENSLQTASFQPPTQEICTVPCDCLVSLWSSWGQCSLTCHDPGQSEVKGHRTRTRRVLKAASNGGLPCPPLQDHQPCQMQNISTCPQYEWYIQDWQPCMLTGNNQSDDCGAGLQTRQVFCIDSGSNILTPLDDSLCQNSDGQNQFKPVSRRACYIDCPVDCDVGHWSHWSMCSKSCGDGAVQTRSREVLIKDAYGGLECPALFELRACESIECAWWHTGRWTTCFLDRGYDDCGPGTRNRAVYCMDALSRRVDASYCGGKTKPERKGTCRVPCADECVVTEWSGWGSCSVTCGPGGGVQKRTRRIIAYPFNRDLNPCLPEDQLTQNKPCNLQVSCHSYSWQTTPWGGCTLNGTASCGEGIGTQTRDVLCEIDTGLPAEPEQCPHSLELTRTRTCDVPCPTDCELSPWSTWSTCSASCGLHATRTRTMRVLTLPTNGGQQCPPETDQNGIITEYTTCINIEPCYTYQWGVSGWTPCQVVGSNCGRGLQTRDVYCGRSDGLDVEAGLCLQDFSLPPPAPTQRCYVPCGGDCLLSEWSEYGPCQANCGTESGRRGYCRLRKRDVVGLGLQTSNPSELCPHISTGDLHQFVPCGLQSASYTWSLGPWTTCILPLGLKCGNGQQSRGAVCLRNDRTQVANLFCQDSTISSQATPMQEQPCKVQCAIDCQVSAWSNWTECSQPCGQGERTRTRTITVQPVQGGRACPFLTDTQMCFDRSCDQLDWDLSEWSPCLPTENRTNCGTGKQTRTVTCPPGPEHEAHCQARTPTPANNQPCHLPCQGECVFSKWSDFTACSEPCISGQKSRSRIIMRPDAELQPCTPLRETVLCTPRDCTPVTYRLVTGAWSQCMPINGDCGRGSSHRTLNCVDSTGKIVGMNLCQHQNITTHETCFVDCPIDCQLGDFTPWTECSDTCSVGGVSYRTREIVTPSSGTGRQCQDVHSLNETKPCNIQPCFAYQWYRGDWSECQFDSKVGCGSGQQTRFVECQRSDGLTVDWEYCYLHQSGSSSLSGWNQLGTGSNQSELDLDTTRQCQTWCPGDCVVSDWSQYTSCYGSCFNATIGGQETRTRVVTKKAVAGGKCTDDFIDTRSCPANRASCPDFTWWTGVWNSNTKTRDVWCQMTGASGLSVVVDGGCNEAIKPPSTKECLPDCHTLGSYCDNGICKCASGFMGNGRSCFPIVGCVSDSHCPFPHTVCNGNRQCTCQPGFYAVDGLLMCVPVHTPDPSLDEDVGTDGNDADISAFSGQRGTWKWVVGAVMVGVVILAAILCGALVYRYWHTGEVHFEPIPHSGQYRYSLRSSFKSGKLVEETKC